MAIESDRAITFQRILFGMGNISILRTTLERYRGQYLQVTP